MPSNGPVEVTSGKRIILSLKFEFEFDIEIEIEIEMEMETEIAGSNKKQ